MSSDSLNSSWLYKRLEKCGNVRNPRAAINKVISKTYIHRSFRLYTLPCAKEALLLRDRKAVCDKVLYHPPCVLGLTHSHRCVSFCRSEVVILQQAMLPLVHLPKKTNKTFSRLHKLTHRCECVRPKTQGWTREKMVDWLTEMKFFSHIQRDDMSFRVL